MIQVWEAANRICSKRLAPFLPELVEVLERQGHLTLIPEVKERLLEISSATGDRLLAEVRHRSQDERQRGTTRSSLRKQHVPIRTFAEWQGAQPGFMEADWVAHWGSDVSGRSLPALDLTKRMTNVLWSRKMGRLCVSLWATTGLKGWSRAGC